VFKGFSGKMTQAVLGFVGTIIFARALGPTAFGGFYLLQSIVFIADRPIKGMGLALTKRLSEDEAPRGEIVGTGIFIAATGSLLVAPVFLLNGPLTAFTGVENAGVVFFSIFSSVSFFFITQRLLEGLGLVGAKVWNDTLRSALTLLAQLAFVLSGFGAAGMGYGLAAGTAVSIGVGVAVVGIRPSVPSAETQASIWAFARYSIPESLVGKVYGRIDTLLLGLLGTTAWVGYYEVGLKISVPASFLSGMIASTLFPKVSNLNSGGEDIAHETQNAISYTSILAIPIFFGAIALPRRLVVTAYGPTYRAAAPVLIGLVSVQMLSSQTSVFKSALRGLDAPDVSLQANLLGLGVNLAVGIGAFLVLGPIGIVFGSVVAEMSQYLFTSTMVVRRVDVKRLSRPLLEQAAAGCGMLLAVTAIKEIAPIMSVVHLGVVVGAGAATYFALLYAVSSSFRLTVGSVYEDVIAEYM